MFSEPPETVNLGKRLKSTMAGRALCHCRERLFPPRCLLCAGPGQWLTVATPAVKGNPAGGRLPLDLCRYCQAGLPEARPAWLPGTGYIDMLLCPWRYDYPVNALVRALKFHGDRVPARVFAMLLAAERAERAVGGEPVAFAGVSAPAPWPALVVPLPLHARRLAARGYNQAGEIARLAAQALHLPLAQGLLVRRRATREQSGLRAAARRANVRGAFGATRRLSGQRLALVDDVITTGATAQAAARELRAAGAGAIELWVLARAGRRSGVRGDDAEQHQCAQPGIVHERGDGAGRIAAPRPP